MAHSMTHDDAMFLSMVNAIRPFAEMLGRVAFPDTDREWLESQLGGMARGLDDFGAILRKHTDYIDAQGAVVDMIDRGCRSPEVRLEAERLVASFDLVSDVAPALSVIVESIGAIVDKASKAPIDIQQLIGARVEVLSAICAALDSVARNQRTRDELAEILEAFNAAGFDDRSEAFTIDNWRTMNREMTELRERARSTGQIAFWGEPLLDD